MDSKRRFGVKRVTSEFLGNFACLRCDLNIGKAVEQEEKLCNEVEMAREFTYLGDRVSAGGGCKAVVDLFSLRNVVS